MTDVCRRLIWVEYAARLKETKNACSTEFWWENFFGNIHFETRDGGVILMWILGRQVVFISETRKRQSGEQREDE
jgi:hypothetical protein